ncbi:hypothetical protein [Nocardia farcinica]|uniref:hypothetical protein n=1 Tax=Nocardia farcinica TaxID=37329 RepID=UPI00189490C2|nr:hypothetical protein [Nocardia farcinica]MBF6411188.1 hypothetical protein [Nocardia farcinica]
MTSPDGYKPAGAIQPGGFADIAGLTEDDVLARAKASSVGTSGSYTRLQRDVQADDGNVLPTKAGLWSTFARDADPTFPRILLTPRADQTGRTSGDGSHSHSITYDDPPDYQPAGGGANLTELGFIECSKDRSYSRITFGTGNSVTALGIQAMYAMAYLMDDDSGALHLMGATGDIKATIASTNREYTVALPGSYDAYKGETWAVGLLQVTTAVQTCKSILSLRQWPTTPPPGQRPAALYAYAPASSTPLTTIPYSSLTFNAGFVPYYALS